MRIMVHWWACSALFTLARLSFIDGSSSMSFSMTFSRLYRVWLGWSSSTNKDFAPILTWTFWPRLTKVRWRLSVWYIFQDQSHLSDDLFPPSSPGYEVVGKWNRTNLSLNMSHHIGSVHRGGKSHHHLLCLWPDKFHVYTSLVSITSCFVGPRRGLFNKKLRVTTILENPYVMRKKDHHLYTG